MNALPWTYICEVCNATRMLQICNLYIRRFLQYRDVIVHDYIPALNTSITANEHGYLQTSPGMVLSVRLVGTGKHDYDR